MLDKNKKILNNALCKDIIDGFFNYIASLKECTASNLQDYMSFEGNKETHDNDIIQLCIASITGARKSHLYDIPDSITGPIVLVNGKTIAHFELANYPFIKSYSFNDDCELVIGVSRKEILNALSTNPRYAKLPIPRRDDIAEGFENDCPKNNSQNIKKIAYSIINQFLSMMTQDGKYSIRLDTAYFNHDANTPVIFYLYYDESAYISIRIEEEYLPVFFNYFNAMIKNLNCSWSWADNGSTYIKISTKANKFRKGLVKKLKEVTNNK